MNKEYHEIIAGELDLQPEHVSNTILLLKDGATIPFISRYRKESTGSMDEVKVGQVRDRLGKLQEIDKRRSAITSSIEEQGKLSDELRAQIQEATSLTELEDIYLPYRPRKKTRASVAREHGLEPLAAVIMKQKEEESPELLAEKYINENVPGVEEALQGARDIIAEWVSENKRTREALRHIFDRKAFIFSAMSKGKEEEGVKYRDYFDWKELLRKCPSHRFLAMRRGEEEGYLKLHVAPPEEELVEQLESWYVKGEGPVSEQVKRAVNDSYKRLLGPSMENEFRKKYKEKADREAIRVFAENLRQLLMAPPLGQKNVLAIDPGFRTGCKIVCLNRQGDLLHNETIYPHPPNDDRIGARKKVIHLVEVYEIEAIAIGNGTASRETESFIKRIPFSRNLRVYVVNEAGASVYSASKIAREEFPEYDVTVRGAVSIGRRLMDPLAELVKIDPKSIGVGQYQHDVDQNMLQDSLSQVVESCVNKVGVSLNTASKHLLTYVSGLGPQLAGNIVQYRTQNGPFKNRQELLNVSRMGEKAFEQCAGFLRIEDGDQPLDNSAVHPESYHIVEKMAADLGKTVSELITNEALIDQIDLQNYIEGPIGLPTLEDIIRELRKPGRDPREGIKVFEFADVHSIEDLKEGMVLPGIVTNITNFGAFVDLGVHQDGLVHISQMANRFVRDPNEIVKLHEHVKVKVLSVDVDRKRIQLSLKEAD